MAEAPALALRPSNDPQDPCPQTQVVLTLYNVLGKYFTTRKNIHNIVSDKSKLKSMCQGVCVCVYERNREYKIKQTFV